MTQITFIEHDGTPHVVNVKSGITLMEAAMLNSVPGIVAECGGACACATCHVYVAPEWKDRVGLPGELEAGMLSVAIEPLPESRLACQIPVVDAFDGLIVRIPASQS